MRERAEHFSPGQPSIGSIFETVCDVFEVRPNYILGPRRLKSAVLARQMVMYLAYEHCAWLSTPRIARYLNRLDHTTIIHGHRAVAERMKRDTSYRALHDKVVERLFREAA